MSIFEAEQRDENANHLDLAEQMIGAVRRHLKMPEAFTAQDTRRELEAIAGKAQHPEVLAIILAERAARASVAADGTTDDA